MLSTNGKNTILSPKISITQQDLIDIPEMKQLQQLIKRTEMRIQSASGKNKYILKKHLIELRQQQYILKNAYKPPIVSIKPTVPNFDIALHFQDDIEVTPDGHVINHGTVSLFNPEHICAILCHYGQLRANCENNINSDCWTLLNQLDHFIDILREKTPFYYDIIKMKTDNKTNEDIQKSLNAKYGYTHSIQYLSSLWRNKIPKMLAEIAEEEYVSWYYTEVERGKWKRCNRCGCVKLANNRYFSKNKGSRDGLYSICKQCRNQSVRKKNADKNI